MLEHPVISDQEKLALWQAHAEGRGARVPVMIGTNARVVHPLPQWNPDGYTFEDCHDDPEAHLKIELQHALYRRQVIGKHSDQPHELPDVWEVPLYFYNIYEAAPFGATVYFPSGQVPTTEPPPFADDDLRNEVFNVDIKHPLDTPYWKGRLRMWREMVKLAADTTFEGRAVKIIPIGNMGTDGPVTAGCNLRGTNFLMDLLTEPEYAQKLMAFVIDALSYRRRALMEEFDGNILRNPNYMLADDSCAMLGLEQWRTLVKPHHKRLYRMLETDGFGATNPLARRGMHMCGNASHLFPALHEELNVTLFDTGFPIDHGAMRRKLGPDVLIQGGPQVQVLLNGSPEQVFERTREILQSGVMEGGYFTLREGNNLPPLVPQENLAAMYAAALEYGNYDQA
ncbi:MAG: hypothetical protein IT445_20805 [Phycisphaeraceae bacterium]|nr:hypothetical protein [Phycisphaeraceae bacterium]